MNTAFPKKYDFSQMSDAQICHLYHTYQISYVMACESLMYEMAFDLIDVIVEARDEMNARHEKTDLNHKDFLNEMIYERASLSAYMCSNTLKPYRIRSWNLIGNAAEVEVYVPASMRPVRWTFRGYKTRRLNRIRKNQTREVQPITVQ